MRYFANPSTERVRDAMTAGLLDFIATPTQGNVLIDGVPWCADNGCFSDKYVGDEAWFDWLAKRAHRAGDCMFATAPDVVGDAAATLERSRPWLARIRALGYPAALVAQDGLERLEVPWDEFDVLFIGGSTEWKLGAAARGLVAEAKARGMWVHMGRVNTGKRFRYAEAIGCDSCDGTTLAQFPDATLPDVLSWLRGSAQLGLFSEVS
jgi:hypothetical protein